MENNFFDDHYRDICSEKTLQSNDQGFFLTFADFVAEEAGENWIKNVFGHLNSNKERIKIIYNYERTNARVVDFLSNVQEIYRKKDAKISRDRRAEGENFFKNRDFQKSLQLFSQSVLRAPQQGKNLEVDNGLSLALALFGRSQVLIELKEYTLALSDLQESQKEGLPNEYKAVVFWKMGICYKSMGEDNRAEVSFEIAKKLLKDDEKLRQMEEEKNIMCTVKNKKVRENKVEPSLTDPSHPDYPSASKKIAIKCSKDMGRHAVANEKICTGDTLVVESPYAAVLLPKMSGTNCHHCFKRLVAPVGCWDCSNVAFCTVQCRNEALATYHKYECKYLDLLIGSGMSILGHTALRIITQNTLDKALEIYKNRGKESIYTLCTNSHLRKAEDFLQRTLMAAFLLKCLQKSGYFGQKQNDNIVPTEQEFSVGEMLLFNLQMLQFNAHEVYETRHHPEHRFRGAKAVYLGVAIYPTVALLNHDCLPAVSRHFVGKTIVIRASRPLEQNELVAENYGPIFTHKRLKDRQIWLTSRYWFTCQCKACTYDWPGLDGLDSVSKRLRCPTKNCENIFTLPVSNETMSCPKCQKEVTLSDRILLLKWCEEQYGFGFDYVKANSEKAIDVLCVALDTFYKISCPPHKDTYLAEASLRACFANSGNTVASLLKPNKVG